MWGLQGLEGDILHIPTHHNAVNEGGGETEGVDSVEGGEKESERRGVERVEENRVEDLMVNKPV